MATAAHAAHSSVSKMIKLFSLKRCVMEYFRSKTAIVKKLLPKKKQAVLMARHGAQQNCVDRKERYLID
jgi:hypothetical protein